MRLSAAALLAGAAVATMAPHATSYVSSSAVVNAPLVAVRAPFDGVLLEGSPAFATGVSAGGRLLRLGAERQNHDAIEAVRAEVGATRAEIAALAEQIGAVSELRTDLRERIAAHDGAVAMYLAAERREAEAALQSAEVQRRQVEAEQDRIAQLAQTGTASQAALERVQADHQMATAEVEERAARRDALDLEARSLGRGIAIDGATDGGVYARQRLDEVTLQLAGLTARRDTLLGRLAALEAQSAAIEADLARRRAFEPVAAAPAVVWRATPARGASVAVGDTLMELLDCEQRFVEVSLPGRHFERVRPGDPATILFKGAGARVGGRVEAVGGAGARFDHPSLASDPAEIGVGDVQVLVRLDPVDPSDADVAASFCDVGRTAEVRFARGGRGLLDRIAAAANALRTWGRAPTEPGVRVSEVDAGRPDES